MSWKSLDQELPADQSHVETRNATGKVCFLYYHSGHWTIPQTSIITSPPSQWQYAHGLTRYRGVDAFVYGEEITFEQIVVGSFYTLSHVTDAIRVKVSEHQDMCLGGGDNGSLLSAARIRRAYGLGMRPCLRPIGIVDPDLYQRLCAHSMQHGYIIASGIPLATRRRL